MTYLSGSNFTFDDVPLQSYDFGSVKENKEPKPEPKYKGNRHERRKQAALARRKK